MTELNDLQERLRTQRPVDWQQLPDFALYMDQVLSYMDRQILRFDDEETLTAAMVNNYTKSGLVPRAEGKKYNREHLAYLTAVCALKQVMPVKDIELLMREELQNYTPEEGYAVFCDSMDRALTATADEIGELPEGESLASAAIHFALLSYAAGLASSRYVSLLRQQKGDEEKNAKPKKKEREHHA